MSERREWGAQVDKSGRLRCYPDGSGVRMDWETVLVREVLPGDEPLACQLGDANLELESLKQRHAKLVEAAQEALEDCDHDHPRLRELVEAEVHARNGGGS